MPPFICCGDSEYPVKLPSNSGLPNDACDYCTWNSISFGAAPKPWGTYRPIICCQNLFKNSWEQRSTWFPYRNMRCNTLSTYLHEYTHVGGCDHGKGQGFEGFEGFDNWGEFIKCVCDNMGYNYI